MTLQLPVGFPDVLSIYDGGWTQGRYLKQYIYHNGHCRIMERNNPQISYSRIERLGGRKYKFVLSGIS